MKTELLFIGGSSDGKRMQVEVLGEIHLPTPPLQSWAGVNIVPDTTAEEETYVRKHLTGDGTTNCYVMCLESLTFHQMVELLVKHYHPQVEG